jgi:uncharacterized membrane protein
MAFSTLAKTSARLWEVDTLRGIAIVLMVFYHFMWDVTFFQIYPLDIYGFAWQSFARFIATLFLFVVGVSLTLSYNREARHASANQLFRKYLLRGGKIFGFGLIITLATYFFIGPGFVIFGILHLIGFSIVAAYPFLKLDKFITLRAGILIILAGIYIDSLRAESPWLIWLGVKQVGRSMVDYYPVFPYFGIVLIGVFVGRLLYPTGVRRYAWPDLSQIGPVQGLRFLGRHSLLIYLIHQPILIGLLFVLGFRPG